MCRAAMADDDVRGGDAFAPRLGTAELQPGCTQRVEVGVFGYTRQPVDAGGLIGDGKRPVIDQSAQVLT